jgi:membrane protease YdiL (CAAX protease family)|tara:strand:- start:1735 stop:2652 length:918 start_codon:yes stop_codon:yes gene_type:complete
MFLKYSESKFDKFGYYLLGSLVIIIFNFIGQIPLTIVFASSLIESNIQINPEANPMDLLKAIPSNLRLFLMLFPFAFSFIGVWLVSNKIHERSITSYFTSRNKLDFKRIFFSFSLWALAMIFFILFDLYVNPENYEINFQPIPFLILFLISLIFMPIATSLEEFIFRGYLMKGFGNLFRNNFLPLIFTSVIFGVVHISNPEVSELGYGTMYFYIGTGFYLGVITLLDDGAELAMGWHAANNLVASLLVTTDWTVLQTNAILKDITEPSMDTEVFLNLLIFYPLLIFIFHKKYNWKNSVTKLTSKF